MCVVVASVSRARGVGVNVDGRRAAAGTVGKSARRGGGAPCRAGVRTPAKTTSFDPETALEHARMDEGMFGRGLFATGTGEVLARMPVNALCCAPAATGEGPAFDAAEGSVRAVYERGWSEHFGADAIMPSAIVDFVVRAPFAKDVRLTAALAWATTHVPAWREYGERVVPAEFDCMYLANEEELEALQDAEIRVMAERSKAGYEATWNAAMEAFPEVKAALGDVDDKRVAWCRSWVHTRAISGKLGDHDCAFLAPTIDLANHRVESTAKYGVSEDGSHFELTWNEDAPEGADPRADAEVFISYGDRMNNALLMLHYGFMDDNNRNERLPMEIIAPGARRVHASRVVDACKALEDAGDAEAALAGSNLLMLAARGPPPGVDAPPPPETDPAVVQAMRDVVTQSLAARPTSLAEDVALLADADAVAAMSPRTHLAVRYRLAQKKMMLAFDRFLTVLA